MPDNPWKHTAWTPVGAPARPWLDEQPVGEELHRMAWSDRRNGLMPAGFIPYVWNIGERLRRAEIAAELREARQRAIEAIRQHPDRDTDPCAVVAVIEQYGLDL